jgi:uncharacterized glyoxalase superfamily protein PhnB
MADVKAIPKGYHAVTPSLVITGADKAIEFYQRAFGAKELSRFNGPDGTIIHALLQIDDSYLMLGEEMPEDGGKSPKSLGGTPVAIFLYKEDVDAAWQQAVRSGAKVTMPLADMFWGDRAGNLEDPFGHRWMLAQHIKDLSPDEVRKAAGEFFAAAR